MSRDLLILLTCCILVNIENVTFLTCRRIQFYKITINNVKLCGANLNYIKWFFNKNWWWGSHSKKVTHHNLPRTICDEISWKVYLLCNNINFISSLLCNLKLFHNWDISKSLPLNSHSLNKSKHLIISVNIKKKRRADV